MEALWNLEDKWKLSTKKAIAVFACTSFLVVGMICVAVALKRRKSRRCKGTCHKSRAEPPLVYPGRPCSVMDILMGSRRWSGPRRGGESLGGSPRETPTPLLVKRDHVGWGHSHNSASAVWQRPILMGEKCELPRFSGLILYDQRGMPLHHSQQHGSFDYKQENTILPGVEGTTPRNLL